MIVRVEGSNEKQFYGTMQSQNRNLLIKTRLLFRTCLVVYEVSDIGRLLHLTPYG